MLARHFKNHSPTPQKCVRVKFPMFANGRNAQLIPLEIVPAMPQIPSASYLKTLDTIGNCQRLVFTVSLSKRMHKITIL